jgi:lysyl endopeptidase
MCRSPAIRAVTLGLALAVVGLSGVAHGAAAAVVAVPPAPHTPSAIAPAAVAVERLLPATAPRHVIVLPAPSIAERGLLKAANALPARGGAKAAARGNKGRPLAIGYGRAAPAAQRTLNGAALTWVALPDGGFAARVDVSSEGAAALRLGLTAGVADPDVSVRFAGSAPGAAVFGPYPGNAVAEAAQRDGAFWSPVLEGATATLEIYRPADVAAETLQFVLARVSHLAVAGTSLRTLTPKDVADIGTAEACEIDVVCVSPPSQALHEAASAVAKMVYTGPDGGSYSCTGTLLNDSLATNTPYFFTAAHCIDATIAATTLNTYWFFDAQVCGRLQIPPYVLLTGGATLLGRSDDWDWALLRLKEPPPIGAFFAAWRAEAVPELAIGTGIHHANGDLKKWSQGTTPGYESFDDGSSFIRMQWTQGVTEVGSSGSGLFTFLGPGGHYELRGGLYGGESSCTRRAGNDYYSRLDKALPYVRQYLTPDAASPNGVVPVVEFHNAALGHYFVSTNPVEINNLDTGVTRGWERTGLRFLAYSNPAQAPAGTTPVCRFYMRPEVGDSHFYSGSPKECDETAAKYGASWIYESPNVFYIQLPNQVTGACPAGTRPVWRFLNTRNTNHRYTAEVMVRDDLRTTPGWIAEGYGADAVIMCSPES